MASQEQLNRQKESIRLEKEYQDALSISAQLMRDIALENRTNNKLTGNARKVMASYNKELNERVNNLNNSQDIAKELVDIDKEILGVQKNIGKSAFDDVLKTKMKSLENTKEAL